MDNHIFKGIPDDSEAPWTELVNEDYHVKVFKDKYPCTPGRSGPYNPPHRRRLYAVPNTPSPSRR